MAKSKIGAYNATIAAIKKSTGVSHKEAQQTYRAAAVRLGRTPTAKDARSKAVREESSRIARGKMTAKERKSAAAAVSPTPSRRSRGGPPGDIGGGPGGGPAGDRGGGRAVAEPEYDDYYEVEYPDIEGEEGDY